MSHHPTEEQPDPPPGDLPDFLSTDPEEGVAGLPVVEVLPEIRQALRREGAGVIVAPPGAGKTTLVPLVLLDEPWLDDRKIIVLEPRRLAARAAARRMSALLGEDDAGGTVGYRVRMDTKVGPGTRIEVVTEGVLTRMLQSDPSLSDVGAVIFDEFHERSLPADLGLALALHSRTLLRDDLRLLVMSATLDAAPVAELLGGDERTDDDRAGGEPGPAAPVISSSGRTYPVETRFLSRPVDGRIEPAVVSAVRRALDEEEGDLLVFLPGAGEIRRTAEALQDGGLPSRVEVFPLFGSLSRGRQDRAIAPSSPGGRKVVLATSIAETSLTIEGVRVVVDSGLMRVPRFDPDTAMTRLETIRVTRDSADQRRGRAGRTAPGVCYRLWTKGEDRGLVPHRRPEILEADLAPLVLELAVWGAGPDELRWLDPPPGAAVAQGEELLQELGVLDPSGAVTDHGRRIVDVGLHPRLAHMLVRSGEIGLGRLGCDLAGLLGDRDVLSGDGRPPDADLRLRVEALRRARTSDHRPGSIRGERVDRGRLGRALREAAHWRRKMGVPEDEDLSPREVERSGLVAAMAYPDRIGRLRGSVGSGSAGAGGSGRFLLRNGRGARLDRDQPLSRSEWIVAVSVEGSGPDARIFQAAPLDLEEVETEFGDQIRTVEEVSWDPEAGRVRAARRRMLGAITLSESPLANPDPDAVARALLDGIRDAGLDALPWSRHTRQLQERLRFLHHVDPEVWPDSSRAALEDTLEEWLLPFLPGMKSLSDLAELSLDEAILSRVSWDARRRLDELAPPRIEVPSGSNITVDYSDPRAPALAVRIQEVFGWNETPRIAGGRIPVTMKLLSPAQRPAQVTTDLASFWSDTYFDVKKDLQGRYPKHYWPEDPHTATATRKVRPDR
ncbi:MAG: ATP-dependent helicase HrpB [Longimicrobiales bacterium]|nr:ATP-dependent helicase HrpB [Longimicrobiales bacterium]